MMVVSYAQVTYFPICHLTTGDINAVFVVFNVHTFKKKLICNIKIFLIFMNSLDFLNEILIKSKTCTIKTILLGSIEDNSIFISCPGSNALKFYALNYIYIRIFSFT